VNNKVLKYFTFGVASAVYGWLCLAIVALVNFFESLQSVVAIVFFMPPVILAVILYYALNKYHLLKSGRAGLNKFIFIVFCEAGWMLAMLVSTIGDGFPPIFDTSFNTVFMAALPSSLAGVIFVAFAIYRCLKVIPKLTLFSFISVFVFISTIGIAIFSFLYPYVLAGAYDLSGRLFDKTFADTFIYLFLFMSWQIPLFVTLPVVIDTRAEAL